ncbi:unnamed protein product [Nippostrongylus brasiliensis]|uniref:Na_Ca_ex domain-containing protein n=1 Tax=Nippostrongylus brasiliensis TaxID=27835 RepID=A0A0N4Y8S4_NIPBR|nr:unnamed protein product [Nippostrongylus brasiliensis]
MCKALVLGLLCVGFTSYVCVFILAVCSFDKSFIVTIAEVDEVPGFDVNNAVIVGFSLREINVIQKLFGTLQAVVFALAGAGELYIAVELYLVM